MDIGALLLITFAFAVIFFTVQRAEPKRRLLVAVFMLVMGILLQRYANYRELHAEALVGFLVALVLNFLFWLLIGRYNPVGSSDRIQVIGMDD